MLEPVTAHQLNVNTLSLHINNMKHALPENVSLQLVALQKPQLETQKKGKARHRHVMHARFNRRMKGLLDLSPADDRHAFRLTIMRN